MNVCCWIVYESPRLVKPGAFFNVDTLKLTVGILFHQWLNINQSQGCIFV